MYAFVVFAIIWKTWWKGEIGQIKLNAFRRVPEKECEWDEREKKTLDERLLDKTMQREWECIAKQNLTRRRCFNCNYIFTIFVKTATERVQTVIKNCEKNDRELCLWPEKMQTMFLVELCLGEKNVVNEHVYRFVFAWLWLHAVCSSRTHTIIRPFLEQILFASNDRMLCNCLMFAFGAPLKSADEKLNIPSVWIVSCWLTLRAIHSMAQKIVAILWFFQKFFKCLRIPSSCNIAHKNHNNGR